MAEHEVVTREQWLKARKALLRDEKAFMRLKDYLAERRRGLPWVRIDKNYTFTDLGGEVSLADLFDGRSQLIVYHFMFGPGWERGCEGCTEVADNFNGVTPYIESRDASFVVISRAPLDRLLAFREHMGWSFKWVSALESDFNYDFNVSFRDPGPSPKQWNFRTVEAEMEETHGVSVFVRGSTATGEPAENDMSTGEDGDIFHTYTSHERAVDLMCANMQYLDLLPKGRQDQLWDQDDFRRR